MQAYWIEGPWRGRLAIVPRPRGDEWLDDEVALWRIGGVDVVISALRADETAAFQLQNEAACCEANGISFVSLPIDDMGVPTFLPAVLEALTPVEARLAAGGTVGVHCRQGLGRAPLIAACLLVLAGVSPSSAFQQIGCARGVSVPETDNQGEWIEEFARKALAAPQK